MFLVGSLWNLAGGAFILSFSSWIFATADLIRPHPPLYFHAWIALFMVFGIGYYMVFLDMYANKNLVILGMIGKAAFSVIFIQNLIAYRSQVPVFFLIPVMGDVIFVFLFAWFLLYARRGDR
jgi:hypothetical protein